MLMPSKLPFNLLQQNLCLLIRNAILLRKLLDLARKSAFIYILINLHIKLHIVLEVYHKALSLLLIWLV